jgi:uncharacterized protein (TIGR04255 family)
MADFDKPPINEVVLGKVFKPRGDLTVPMFGRFWDLIEEDFPKTQHAPPLIEPGGHSDKNFMGILPRVWFVGEDPSRLIQLQQDRLYYNWRQLAGVESPYARFESIFAEYQRYSEAFATFILSSLGSPLESTRLDLTYVNVFQRGREWQDFSDLGSVISGLDVLSNAQTLGKASAGSFQIDLKPNSMPGLLSIRLLSGFDTGSGAQLIKMELVAVCGTEELAGVEEKAWYLQAHDAIIEAFCTLTTDKAQKIWMRRSD